MKNTYVLLTVVLIASASAVIGLHLLTNRQPPPGNGFTRLFVPSPTTLEHTLDLQYNSYYLAGASSNRLYFGNTTAPLHLVSTTHALTDSQHIRLRIQTPDTSFLHLQVKVAPPYFYLLDGFKPVILRGLVSNWTATRRVHDTTFFTEAAPLGSASFALRMAAGSPPQYLLAKASDHPPALTRAPQALVRQVDGLFCTDGTLLYDQELHTVVYVYYYRNEFICMDTLLNVRYRGKTIDTVSHARLKIARIKADKSIILASPPLVVNSQSCVSGNYLYVRSNLKATNETQELFDQLSAIDVYDLRDGTYQYSFYIANANGKKMDEFGVVGKTLVARHGQHVYTYRLDYPGE